MLSTTTNPETISRIDDDRWHAVQIRDGSRDGEFVFAVSSTGIYCRPSCPARRPIRENVRFFADPPAAERAGFRPCRRCRPRAEQSARQELASRAAAWIDDHLEERVTLPRLSAALGVSPGHLQRTFTRVMGVSPHAYAAARRLAAAKARMRAGADVTSAIHAAGYGSSSRFYDQARTRLGMAPSAYRKGGAGITIGYAIGDSTVGRILVAATERGICAVSVADNDDALLTSLRAEFPQAAIRQDDAVQPFLDAALAHLRERSSIVALPLDVAGTPFQHEVWHALREIPSGERRTYGEIAGIIGKPGAARAVASACAANPAALLIPCHRVVRADGKAGGYRWGAERKQALLASEAGNTGLVS